MKKSTILILLIVFLGSILVVGFFGMRSVPFEQIVYMEQIIPTGIITTDGEDLTNQMQIDERGHYYVMITYKEGLTILINWGTIPETPTYKDIDINIVYPETDIPATINGMGAVEFHRPGAIRIQYKAKDNAATKAIMDFWIYCIEDTQQ